MHTLTTFPHLLDYGLAAPLLLRLTVGFFILVLTLDVYKKSWRWAIFFYAIVAILLVLGLYTQLSAIAGVIILKADFYINYWKNRKEIRVSKEMYMLYTLADIILLSLLVTGPGFFAFDLPF